MHLDYTQTYNEATSTARKPLVLVLGVSAGTTVVVPYLIVG